MKNPILTKIDISLVNRDTEMWLVTLYEANDKVYIQKKYVTYPEAIAFLNGVQFAHNLFTCNVLPVSQNSL
jgi:hypothetical protein